MDHFEKLTSIIEHYGKKQQMVVAMEEMSELQKELAKNFRGHENRHEIIEELSDVSLMLDELMIMFDINQMTVDYNKSMKIGRTMKRIAEEKEGN